uniref:Pathogenicity determinant protein D n=1 Tax=Strongyloides stercoralis TaxID=6248 RepID=A0A0K0EAB2_STRER
MATYRIETNTYSITNIKGTIHIIKDNLINFNLGFNIKNRYPIQIFNVSHEHFSIHDSVNLFSSEELLTLTFSSHSTNSTGEGELLSMTVTYQSEALLTSLLDTSISSPIRLLKNILAASIPSFDIIRIQENFVAFIKKNPQFKKDIYL